MNIAKAELKMLHAQTWGREVDELETTARRDLHRLEGGRDALKGAAQALNGHRQFYDKQFENEELSGETRAVIMRVIDRCIAGLDNLHESARLKILVKQGELTGLRRSGDLLEKAFTQEKQRLAAISDALAKGEDALISSPDNPLTSRDVEALRDKREKEMEAEKAARREASQEEPEEPGEEEPDATNG